MNSILIGFTFLISTSHLAFANIAQCEKESYQVTTQDYSGDCIDLILKAASKAGCNKKHVFALRNSILSGNLIKLKSGSSSFCKIETSSGHYQVMKDDMPEPPVATLYYSRND